MRFCGIKAPVFLLLNIQDVEASNGDATRHELSRFLRYVLCYLLIKKHGFMSIFPLNNQSIDFFTQTHIVQRVQCRVRTLPTEPCGQCVPEHTQTWVPVCLYVPIQTYTSMSLLLNESYNRMQSNETTSTFLIVSRFCLSQQVRLTHWPVVHIRFFTSTLPCLRAVRAS